MLPTPSTSHVPFNHVYEPAEDSFLLLDTLSSESETAFLKARFNPRASRTVSGSTPSESLPSHGRGTPLVVEVGTGSGVVLAFLAANAETIFGRSDVLTVGTDVNGVACRAARETVGRALAEGSGESSSDSAVFLGPLLADLAAPFRPGTVDVLVFNPPYVPSETLPTVPISRDDDAMASMERGETSAADDDLLALSYAGGVDGMETTQRLLDSLPSVLSAARGVAYVLLCAQNRPDEVVARIRGWGPRWEVETVGWSGKKAGWEKLRIVRIARTGGSTVPVDS